jgi:hypothetical protein
MLYLVQKPQVLGKITQWLIFFLGYDFLVIYKPGISHYVADALSRMPNLTTRNGVLDQIIDVSFFLLQLVWLQKFFEYFTIENFLVQYNQK